MRLVKINNKSIIVQKRLLCAQRSMLLRRGVPPPSWRTMQPLEGGWGHKMCSAYSSRLRTTPMLLRTAAAVPLCNPNCCRHAGLSWVEGGQHKEVRGGSPLKRERIEVIRKKLEVRPNVGAWMYASWIHASWKLAPHIRGHLCGSHEARLLVHHIC